MLTNPSSRGPLCFVLPEMKNARFVVDNNKISVAPFLLGLAEAQGKQSIKEATPRLPSRNLLVSVQ